MATKELREARHKYKAAYTAYMQSVRVLSDASEHCALPDAQAIEAEHAAFAHLALARQELWEKLKEHCAL